MKLTNIQNDIFFEMEFVGFENTTEDWLLLKIIVKHKNLIFEKIDPKVCSSLVLSTLESQLSFHSNQ